MSNGVPCYLRGTHIRTPEGERKIEALKIGDPVVTLSGESKPIKWIGRERFKKSSKCWPEDFVPVRISRFALDDRSPLRDLYLSRNHCIYIDEVLVPAKYLVNGRSITRAAPEGTDTMEYLHVELFAHDVIYAEGVTAESFAGWGREHFENFAEYHRLYPNEPETEHPPFAPVLWESPVSQNLAQQALTQSNGPVDRYTRDSNPGQDLRTTCCTCQGVDRLTTKD